LDPNALLSFFAVTLFHWQFCGCQLAKWLLLAIQAHQDLLWFAQHESSTHLRKYSIAIWFLNDFTEETHLKITFELYAIQTLTKLLYRSVA